MSSAVFSVGNRRMMGEVYKENPKTIWVLIPEKVDPFFALGYQPKMNCIKRHKKKHQVKLLSY
jgi:hypothetical protein